KEVAGITADEKYLVAFGPTSIWRLRHADVSTLTPWERIDNPAATFAEIKNGDWGYQDVYACRDGSLLAIVNRQLYLWHAPTKKWTRNADTVGTEMLKVFKLPVEGEDVFRHMH